MKGKIYITNPWLLLLLSLVYPKLIHGLYKVYDKLYTFYIIIYYIF